MKKKSKPYISAGKVVFSKDRRLILIDQMPLRRAAEKDALKGLREAAKVRTALEEFERRILPEYTRWEESHLSPLLAEERAIEAKIYELEDLLDEMIFAREVFGVSGKDTYDDFVKTKARQNEKPAEKPDEPSRTEIPDFPEDEGLSDSEVAFRMFMRYSEEVDPLNLRKSDYKRFFEAFCKSRKYEEPNPRSKPKVNETPLRIKELYRTLVRRLHPDTGNLRQEPVFERLWHDLQDAYAAQDIDRMELLLAMTDLQCGEDGMKSTLFHMRRAAAEFLKTAREMKSRLNKARKTPAWMFWHSPDREKTAESFLLEVRERIFHTKKILSDLQSSVDAFVARKPPKASPTPPSKPSPKPSAKSKKNPKAREPDQNQTFFDF